VRSTIFHGLTFTFAFLLAACGSSRESSSATDAGADASLDDAAADQAADAPMGPPAIPLSSCVPTVYTVQATIGTQQFQLTLDTGSTTLGVASTSCSTCTEATPKYKPGSTAVDEHSMAMSVYGSGEWTGEIYQDSVSLGSEASVPLKLVAIDSQADFFGPIHCDSKSGGFQGILGLAPAASALPGTNAFFDEVVAKQHVPNVFAIELCDSGGTLWLGGYDETFATGAPTYVPLSGFVSQLLYGVPLTSISVDGMSAPIASASFTDSIVDTGTSQFIIPTAALTTISGAIAASPKFGEIFGSGVDASFFASPTNCAPISQTKAEIDAALPPLTLVFGSASVQALPTESYLVPYQGQWCNTLYAMDPSNNFPVAAILGSPVLRSNLIIFDRAKKRIGFAPHKPCM
jgi:hypothetical protein